MCKLLHVYLIQREIYSCVDVDGSEENGKIDNRLACNVVWLLSLKCT